MISLRGWICGHAPHPKMPVEGIRSAAKESATASLEATAAAFDSIKQSQRTYQTVEGLLKRMEARK